MKNKIPPLSKQINLFKNGKFGRNDTFIIAKTNKLFSLIGYTNIYFTLDKKHFRYCTENMFYYKEKSKGITEEHILKEILKSNNNHSIGEETLYLIPELLKSPIAVLSSNTMGTTRHLIILNYKHNGSFLCMATTPNGYGTWNGVRFPAISVMSIYAKESAPYILEQRLNSEINIAKTNEQNSERIYYINLDYAFKIIKKPLRSLR